MEARISLMELLEGIHAPRRARGKRHPLPALLGLAVVAVLAGMTSGDLFSLWTVGDEPKRAMMARFYENLWRNGLPARAALLEAQL